MISIHAPHEGERPYRATDYTATHKFQSTLPTRGSDGDGRIMRGTTKISIHAPHEGERRFCCNRSRRGLNFNPRSPRGGATREAGKTWDDIAISIHAPHEGERHITTSSSLAWIEIFQSTLPTRGSDSSTGVSHPVVNSFQSTLPTRGSDYIPTSRGFADFFISIHAPHEGERQYSTVVSTTPTGISIHAPHEGERRKSRGRG